MPYIFKTFQKHFPQPQKCNYVFSYIGKLLQCGILFTKIAEQQKSVVALEKLRTNLQPLLLLLISWTYFLFSIFFLFADNIKEIL